MSITIPSVVTISGTGGTAVSTTSDLPVSSVSNGDGTHTHTYGIPYKGGKSTFAFYGDATAFNNVTKIEIQAAFDGGQLTNGNPTAPALHTGNFITLTDNQDAIVSVTGNDIVSIDIGKCMLRFKVTVTGTMQSDIHIAVS